MVFAVKLWELRFAIDDLELVLGVINTTLTRRCPSGQVCSSAAGTCNVPSTGFPADCSTGPIECGVCSSDCRFACLGPTTFVYCFGLTSPSPVTGSCPSGTYCDLTVGVPAFCSTNAAVRRLFLANIVSFPTNFLT